MKIFKYPIPPNDQFMIQMPKGAKILCVQMQNNIPCIWAMVDEKAPLRTRYFSFIGTGHEFSHHDDVSKYIGTIQMNMGSLVFHLFEDSLPH